MKKKLFFVLIFVLPFIKLTAQSIKYYYDRNRGYAGYAQAIYMGTTKTIDPGEFANQQELVYLTDGRLYFVRHCDKLSNQEIFLTWSALDEYNYEDNEIYNIIIQQGEISLTFVAVIKNNGNSIDWYGGSIWTLAFY